MVVYSNFGDTFDRIGLDDIRSHVITIATSSENVYEKAPWVGNAKNF